ncbi:MAG: trypsin-like peptidase domain-containing protein [Actinobacteria bacterium]|nr:trypsin-like peptidase domain-containing protein [Actinomycetota bacterium]
MRRYTFAALVVALLLTGCASSEAQESATVTETVSGTETAPAEPTASGDDEDGGVFSDIPDLVDEVQPAVVAVGVRGGEGSGVIWDSDGIVVTNNHVVEGAGEVEVVFANGDRVPADVRARDPLTDLAVLEVEASSLPAARFSEELPRVGELAVALGNPLGFQNTVTAGIVSGVHRAIPASGSEAPALVDLIQTDAAISPGNSGGALVNGDGEVIGINLAYIPPETGAVAIGFAIPSATVSDVVRQLLEDGTAEHAYLGVRPAELTPQLAERFGVEAERGILVASVVEGSAADEAGVEAGDVIVAVDGEEMRPVEDLLALLRKRSPGDVVTLAIDRNGERMEIDVELADRPQ